MKKTLKFIVPAIVAVVIGFFAFAHEAHNKPAANVAANTLPQKSAQPRPSRPNNRKPGSPSFRRSTR